MKPLTYFLNKMRAARRARYSREEAAFLPAALAIQECPPAPLPGLIIGLISSLLLIGILWATLGKVDIVTLAPGAIGSEGRVQVVQAAETGEVKRILIRDGQTVRKGQVLVELDAASADVVTHRTQVEVLGAELTIRRAYAVLEALADSAGGTVSVPSGMDIPELPGLLSSARQHAASQIGEAATRRQQLDGDIAQREIEQARAAAELNRINAALRFAVRRETDFRELAEKKFVSGHAR